MTLQVICYCSPASRFNVFFKALLLVTNSYFSYSYLPIGSKPSGNISSRQNIFTHSLPLTGQFLFFRTFSVNRRNVFVEKSTDQQFVKCSEHQRSCHIHLNSLKCPFFSILMLSFSRFQHFSRLSWPCLNVLNCCDWLITYFVREQLSRSTYM